MKTQPIGIRFEKNEYEMIQAFALSNNQSFSEAVRGGVLAHIAAMNLQQAMSLEKLAKLPFEADMTLAFGEFLDDFARATDKYALIEKEPAWHPDDPRVERWMYDFAATAHKLAHANELPVPKWALKDEYIAPVARYAFNTTNPEYQDYLRRTTPREFVWHNLYLGENILSRA